MKYKRFFASIGLCLGLMGCADQGLSLSNPISDRTATNTATNTGSVAASNGTNATNIATNAIENPVTYADESAALQAAEARRTQADLSVLEEPAPKAADVEREVVSVVSRRKIWIVGDPAMVEDAETILRVSGFPDLETEGNGTDSGITAFCAGIGFQSPDIVAASRPFSENEQQLCEANSVRFSSIGAIGGFLALKDAHIEFVPNLSEAFEALR